MAYGSYDGTNANAGGGYYSLYYGAHPRATLAVWWKQSGGSNVGQPALIHFRSGELNRQSFRNQWKQSQSTNIINGVGFADAFSNDYVIIVVDLPFTGGAGFNQQEYPATLMGDVALWIMRAISWIKEHAQDTTLWNGTLDVTRIFGWAGGFGGNALAFSQWTPHDWGISTLLPPLAPTPGEFTYEADHTLRAILIDSSTPNWMNVDPDALQALASACNWFVAPNRLNAGSAWITGAVDPVSFGAIPRSWLLRGSPLFLLQAGLEYLKNCAVYGSWQDHDANGGAWPAWNSSDDPEVVKPGLNGMGNPYYALQTDAALGAAGVALRRIRFGGPVTNPGGLQAWDPANPAALGTDYRNFIETEVLAT